MRYLAFLDSLELARCVEIKFKETALMKSWCMPVVDWLLTIAIVVIALVVFGCVAGI